MTALKKIKPTPIESAGAIYCTNNDVLRIIVSNSVATQHIRVTIRFMSIKNEVTLLSYQYQAPVAATPANYFIKLQEGYILSIIVSHVGTGGGMGTLYCAGFLVSDQSAAALHSMKLFSGYITLNLPVSYPSNVSQMPLLNHGSFFRPIFANPAAGADLSFTIPLPSLFHLLSLKFTFTTDVNVANRIVSLIFDDGGVSFYQIFCPANHAAGLTYFYEFSRNFLSFYNQSNHYYVSIPDFFLPGNYRILTSITNIQVGDQISSIGILFERFLEV